MAWFDVLAAVHDRYIGNIAAIILVGTLFAAYRSKASGAQREDRVLIHLLGNIALYSLVEIISCIYDGVPGAGMAVLLHILNSSLFVINMLLGSAWAQLIVLHLGYTVSKRTKVLLFGLLLCGLLLLVVNLFVPIIYTLEGNVYSEDCPLFPVFLGIAAVYFSYSMFVYATCRRNGGVLKYFPVWMYIVPAVTGILLELWLQSSLMSICNAIAISAVLSSMQQEDVFRDRLTGLYNRAYLEELKAKLEKTRNPYVSGIMLDLNGFKSINDNFGHAEGDQALITAATLIREGAGSYGDVIRYAGDEFVIILNTLDREKLTDCVNRIHASFDSYNDRQLKPYRLSASVGFATFNAGTQTVNEFLNTIDKNMYENKREYYRQCASVAEKIRPNLT